MMQYVDFKWYQETYLGTSIRSPTGFDQLSRRAFEYIDLYTFSRIPHIFAHGAMPMHVLEKIQTCICAVADAIHEFLLYSGGNSDGDGSSGTSASFAGRGVKSETQHNYQIQYLDYASLLAGLTGKDHASLDEYIKSLCVRHLLHTGLMYKGCDFDVHKYGCHHDF